MYEVRIPQTILNKMNFAERGIYSTLKEYMNWNDYTCYPSIATLADKLKCSQNTVRKYLKQIEKKGLITITRRKRVSRKGTKFNLSNLYTFIAEKTMGVLQKSNKGTTKVADKQELIKEDKNKNMTIESIRYKLNKKFGQDIVQKALQCLSKATEKGTVVNNLFKYLERLCLNIKAQMELVKSIDSDVGFHDTIHKQKSKNPSGRNTGTKVKTKFHNLCDSRTSRYTAEELENMVRYKFK